MGKSIHSLVIKSALSYIKDNCSYMYVCSEWPSTAAMASNTEMLASASFTSTQMTVSAAASGAHLTMSAINSINVSTTGNAQHIALVYVGAASKVLCVITCTSQALTAGNTVNVPAWSYTINDPT